MYNDLHMPVESAGIGILALQRGKQRRNPYSEASSPPFWNTPSCALSMTALGDLMWPCTIGDREQTFNSGLHYRHIWHKEKGSHRCSAQVAFLYPAKPTMLYPTHLKFPSCEADMSPVPRDAGPNSLGNFKCE
jgi:hypothetical protein